MKRYIYRFRYETPHDEPISIPPHLWRSMMGFFAEFDHTDENPSLFFYRNNVDFTDVDVAEAVTDCYVHVAFFTDDDEIAQLHEDRDGIYDDGVPPKDEHAFLGDYVEDVIQSNGWRAFRRVPS